MFYNDNMYKLTDPQDKKVFKQKGSTLQIERKTGRTAAAINQMNTLDVLSAMPPEIIGKIISDKVGIEQDDFRRLTARIANADSLANSYARYQAIKNIDEEFFGGFEMRQEQFDEENPDAIFEDPDQYFTQRPTLLDFSQENFMDEADDSLSFGSRLYSQYDEDSQFPQGENSRLAVQNVITSGGYYDALQRINDTFADYRNDEGEKDNLEAELERILRAGSIGEFIESEDGLERDVGELEQYAYDSLHTRGIFGPFTDANGIWNEPFAPTSTYVGRRADFQQKLRELHDNLSPLITRSANEFQEFDDDDEEGDELLREPKNIGEFLLALENWQNRYDDTPNDDMTEEERELNDEIDNLVRYRNELMETADSYGSNTYIAHDESYREYARELNAALEEYTGALRAHTEMIDGTHVFNEGDFGQYGVFGELDDETKDQIRRNYRVEA